MTKKSYKKHKSSKIDWLGRIPEHWKEMPFKYKYHFSMGQTILQNDLEDNGNTPVISATEGESYFGYISNPQFILEKGDFVIPARGTIGAIKMITRPSVCTQTTIYAKKRQSFLGLNDKFVFFYQIGCRNHLFQYDKTAIPQITVEQVKNNPMLLPPLKEQKAIANFLDKETSWIDFLMKKKEKQIELLKEKRSVLITQTVTKGLNSNVKMRDSGVEWLGKIPEHWKLIPFKYKYCFSMGQTILANDLEDNGRIPVISATEEDHYFGYISNPQFILEKGDFVIPARGISIGAVKIIIEPSVSTQTTIYAKKNTVKNLESNFIFFYQIGCRKYLFQYDRTAIPQITVEQVKNNPMLLPPLKEQKAIVDFLDKETSQIDSLIEKVKKSIELLKEYRLALITSTVTGQIDVRKSQTQDITAQKTEKQDKVLPIKISVSKRKKVSHFVKTTASIKGSQNLMFKKAVLGAEIVTQLKDDPHFGRTKFMKTLYLCESHLQIPLKGIYKREAAGPLDSSIYKMEGIMKKNKWFKVIKKEAMFKYQSLKNSTNYKPYFDKYWGDWKKELNQLLSLMKEITTEQSEIVDTIYAVWNDFLLEGKKPSNNEIIYEVKNNWHKSKKRFPDDRLQKAIYWMKIKNLIPKGHGSKTIRSKI